MILHARPYGEEDDSLEKSYVKFFNLEELIKKINIKRFREFQKSSDENENTIPAIDLTQEAIANDKENPADNVINNGVEETVVNNEATEIDAVADVDQQEEKTTKLAIIETTTLKISETDESVIKEEAAQKILGENSDKFFISEESVNAARKYGYKILLKKIGGKVVPVGKIKFEFPTLIEISPIEDEVLTKEIEKTTIAPAVQETTEAVENNPAVTAVTQAITEAIITTTSEAIIETTTTAIQP